MNDETATKANPPGISTAGFLILFLVPAAFTYLSGMLLLAAAFDESAGTRDDAGTIRITYLAVCYVVMALACFYRGKRTDKKWLVVFPVLGGLFDMFFGIIPFVPSVLNIVALVVGIQGKKDS